MERIHIIQMPFSVPSYIADSEGKILALDWVYSNDIGQITNRHTLAMPEGVAPMEDVNSSVLIGWLVDQLETTAEDLDKAIGDYKTQMEYQQTLRQFALGDESGTYDMVEPQQVEESN